MLTAAVAVLAVSGVSSASGASDDSGASAEGRGTPSHARVTGHGDFTLPYHQDEDVRSFSFDAVAAPYSRPLPGIPTGLPTDARGTVRISHYSAERDVTYTAEGRVDCLVTGPRSATLTAVITKVGPGGPVDIGRRLGFSVHDAGKDGKNRSGDRVGFSWNGVNLLPGGADAPEEATVGTCMAPAPYAPVTKGGYTVVHAELPAPAQH
ncbi:hypothetical protein [Streptomyces sp. Tu 2975]|uniref:hypothetical protein n=1 Tax=Streptomyces sp. Tu 2975 TaxID=2676871 RepID=UPI001FCA1A4D|nr:hypothetical protein [Streptomyces sp. Tu 2975]